MSGSLQWSRAASISLQRVAEFIRAHSPAQEEKVIDAIVGSVDQLRQYPRSGQKRELLPQGTELRTLLVAKRYRVLYSVTTEDAVNILQVLDLRGDHDIYR